MYTLSFVCVWINAFIHRRTGRPEAVVCCAYAFAERLDLSYRYKTLIFATSMHRAWDIRRCFKKYEVDEVSRETLPPLTTRVIIHPKS